MMFLMTNDFGMQSFYTRIRNIFETMEVNLLRLHDLVDKAIEKYPDNRSFQIYKSRISVPEQFEFPIEPDNDEDAAIATPDFGQDAEEESDDDDDDDEDEDDVNNNDGNDDDGNDDDDHGDAGIAVGVNDEKDENEDEAVGGNGGNEEESTDINSVIDNVVQSVIGSQYPIQVTQVESLNVQLPAGIFFLCLHKHEIHIIIYDSCTIL